jgi:exoribonuclease II
MERYWCLRWLAQENVKHVDAVVLKDEVLRLVDIPLIIRLPGMPQVARGTQVKLDVIRWDEVDLSIEARLLEIAAAPSGEQLEEAEEEMEDQAAEEIVAGPVEGNEEAAAAEVPAAAPLAE